MQTAKEKKKNPKFKLVKQGRKEKRRMHAVSFLFLGIFLLVVGGFIYCISKQNISVASMAPEERVYRKNETDKIEIETMLEENKKKARKEEMVVEEAELEYLTKYENDPKLAKGSVQVRQEGRIGLQEIITKRVYQGDELIEEKQVGTQITKAAITKIVAIGTGNYVSNHQVKKGDEVYVTSDRLAIYVEPEETSSKILTLARDEKVTVIEIADSWYQITYQNYKGWAKAECLTYLDPNAEKYEEQNRLSKSELLSRLSKNMELNKPSGFTLEQFKKVLSGNSKDKNKIWEQNAEYFYYIEKQYHINGIFVAAVGIHESSWGTSTIAKEKMNLFGYGAYDNSAYTSAYHFSDYAEGIDLMARVFTKHYLNPKGTKIYDEQEATGKHYHGSTIEAVNKKYATDENWKNSVYHWMEYLYNRL